LAIFHRELMERVPLYAPIDRRCDLTAGIAEGRSVYA
jgi:hypothetical protein